MTEQTAKTVDQLVSELSALSASVNESACSLDLGDIVVQIMYQHSSILKDSTTS